MVIHDVYIGDNVETLKKFDHNTVPNGIDVIYIDPPYGHVKGGSKIDVVYKNNYSREKLLKNVDEAVSLAYNFLNDDGQLWFHCDFRNVHHFRIILDNIFKEKNFVCSFPRKTRTAFSCNYNGINKQHDELLLYAKDIKKLRLHGKVKELKGYKNPDNDPNGVWKNNNCLVGYREQDRAMRYFPITNPYTGKVALPPNGRMWSFSTNTIQRHIDSGRLKFLEKHTKDHKGFIFKGYAQRLRSSYELVSSLEFYDNECLNCWGAKELRELKLGEKFKFAKPTALIEKILKLNYKDDVTILDFYAGSGTTGVATINLNKKDNGTRKSIMIGLDEKNVITDCAIPRLKHALQGETTQELKVND